MGRVGLYPFLVLKYRDFVHHPIALAYPDHFLKDSRCFFLTLKVLKYVLGYHVVYGCIGKRKVCTYSLHAPIALLSAVYLHTYFQSGKVHICSERFDPAHLQVVSFGADVAAYIEHTVAGAHLQREVDVPERTVGVPQFQRGTPTFRNAVSE